MILGQLTIGARATTYAALFAAVASSTRPQIYFSKVKVKSKYVDLKQLIPWKWRQRGKRSYLIGRDP